MTAIIRDDLSDRLVHLTKGEGADALKTFLKIVNERVLLGGSGYIKGGFKCVCFSEAPISKLPQILATPHDAIRYRPFGFLFKKAWVFARGGLPVIYQPDPDFKKLPDEKKHLHVRFYLGDYSIDHTWEREWRIRTDRLEFTPANVTLLMPTRAVSDALRKLHFDKETKALESGEVADRSLYPWHHVVLEDLGVPVPNSVD